MEEISVLPKQPFFVLATNHYSKILVYEKGISHFYSFYKSVESEARVIAVPDGCVDIVFCYSEHGCWAKMCGTVLHAQTPFANEQGNYRIFGIRFMPGVIPAGFRAKMVDLVENEVPLETVEIENGFTRKMLQITDFEEEQKYFWEYYLKYYFQETEFDSKSSLNQYIVNEIVGSAGMKPMAEIVDGSGYSDRYINRSFKADFGMVPKQFAKIIRFQHLLDNLNLMEDSKKDFAKIATDMGYYDQPHMIKDFKDYTEITPQRYLKMMNEENFGKRIIINEMTVARN